jgi:putative DNA primase/helicase
MTAPTPKEIAEEDALDAAAKAPEVPGTHQRWAEAMVAAGYAARLLYVTHIGWHYWDGKRWYFDAEDKESYELVCQFVKSHRDVPWRLKDLGRDEPAKEAFSRIARAEQDGFTKAILSNLSAKLRCSPFDLDPDPWLLNCANGTLNLRTGELSKHDPAQRITMITRAAWLPGSLPGSRYETAMETILPSRDKREFVQQAIGLAIAGDVLEQIALVMHGPTASNGKSTHGEAVMEAMGDYAGVGDPALLTTADKHEENIAVLHRKRMIFFSELPEDKALAAAGFKRMTGNDTLTARHLYKRRFEYVPQFTIIIRANDLPYVPGDDEATWRRLKIVHYDQVFAGENDDRGLANLLRSDPGERAAILEWLNLGLQRYLARPPRLRYQEPPCVIEYTAECRGDGDLLGQFLADWTEPAGPESRVPYHDVYQALVQWYALRAEGPLRMTQNTLTRRLKKRRGLSHGVFQGERGLTCIALKGPGELLKTWAADRSKWNGSGGE